ncbi:MAG: hypothetical protein ACLVD8_06435 [Enterocloster sp.]|uniref:hypothetical protein n=1 Tax=Enterocloster sp. TaxID=2719315 RepID=UPI00399BE392
MSDGCLPASKLPVPPSSVQLPYMINPINEQTIKLPAVKRLLNTFSLFLKTNHITTVERINNPPKIYPVFTRICSHSFLKHNMAIVIAHIKTIINNLK